jgi:CubicO group peptidase (beta-lactamase class C family)
VTTAPPVFAGFATSPDLQHPLVERDSAYDDGALVEWGSITKSVTAMAVAAAIDHGLLNDDTVVRDVVHRFPRADYTVTELVDHRSGLLRLPMRMALGRRADPYAPVVGAPLPARWTRPLGDRGRLLYSNTGYAVLGSVLDEVTGGWWGWATEHVLAPAGVRSAVLVPTGRPLAVERWDARRTPWSLGAGPFAAAGGIWSTFEDLARFGRWATRDAETPPGWTRHGGADVVDGGTRDANALMIRAVDDDAFCVVHSYGAGRASAAAATQARAVDLIRSVRRRPAV